MWFHLPADFPEPPPSVYGFVCATSVLCLAVLGDQRQAFERDIERCLLGLESTGSVVSWAVHAYDLAPRQVERDAAHVTAC
jgi:hypothetical protein